MSHAQDHDHDDDDDAHDDHAFDDEPARELGPDETPTPAWVPATGATIFAVAGIAFLVTRAAPAPSAGTAQTAAPQITAAQVATAVPARPPIQAPRPAQPAAQGAQGAPGAAGANTAALNRMSPEQLKDLQRRIQEAAQKAKPQGAGAK
jgi:hypothetical protein